MTQQSKHTPGPWRARAAERDGGCAKALIVAESEVSRLPICPAEAAGRDVAQANANARLIAQAPEMYELVETIEKLVVDDGLDLNDYTLMLGEAARRIKAEIDEEG
ncbi:hypothetical protein LCGC14_2136240 [marine sediment metagenome]|uniref:Uncharacterized protein n=1 Tax=marine sediment metagenome TaxID=412755 RepID=A0A0F9GW50_9ZZZZ